MSNKIYRIPIMCPISKTTHEYGYHKIISEAFNGKIARHPEELNDNDLLILTRGVNEKPKMERCNFFGGFSEMHRNRIVNLLDFNGKHLWFDGYKDFSLLSKRISTGLIFEDEVKMLSKKFYNNRMEWHELNFDKAIIGDSHCLSFSESNQIVLKTDGATLYGSLTNGRLLNKINLLKPNVKEIDICLGSIDIRHHLLRFDNPKEKLKELLNDLFTFLSKIEKRFEQINICSPVPVEHEERKIPRTSWYKDSPFYGSRNKRLELTFNFIDIILKSKYKLISPPATWYNMDGKEYAKSILETHSKGPHISYPNYRRNQWGTLK